MMIKKQINRSQRIRLCRGNSVVEIMSVIVFLIAVTVAFRGYIKNGFAGHWKATGDALGQGKQYDPRAFGTAGEKGGTLDCFRDTATDDPTYQQWIDESCYRQNNCDCTLRKYDGAKLADYAIRCEFCKQTCQDDRCE